MTSDAWDIIDLRWLGHGWSTTWTYLHPNDMDANIHTINIQNKHACHHMQGLGKHSNIQTNTCYKHTYHHTKANIQTSKENKNMGGMETNQVRRRGWKRKGVFQNLGGARGSSTSYWRRTRGGWNGLEKVEVKWKVEEKVGEKEGEEGEEGEGCWELWVQRCPWGARTPTPNSKTLSYYTCRCKDTGP